MKSPNDIRRRRTSAPRLLLPLLLVLFWSPALRGEIIDCFRAGDGRSYTVYLDEPSYAEPVFSSDGQLQIFMDRLWFFLDQDRERRWIESSDLPVGFALCQGRKPSLDGREFDAQLVDLLYNKGVLVEIWGTLDARAANGGLSDRQAHIGYLLVPVEFVTRAGGGPSGKFFVRYSETPGGEAEDFLEFFRNTTDLDAFVAVSLGVKALRAGDFPLAQGNLCRARLMLEQQLQRGQVAGQRKARLRELAAYAGEAAAEAIRSARQQGGDPTSLDLLDPAQPCPREGTP